MCRTGLRQSIILGQSLGAAVSLVSFERIMRNLFFRTLPDPGLSINLRSVAYDGDRARFVYGQTLPTASYSKARHSRAQCVA